MVRLIIVSFLVMIQWNFVARADQAIITSGEIKNLKGIGDNTISVYEDNLLGQPEDNVSEKVGDYTPEERHDSKKDSRAKRHEATLGKLEKRLDSGEYSDEQVEELQGKLNHYHGMFNSDNARDEEDKRKILLREMSAKSFSES